MATIAGAPFSTAYIRTTAHSQRSTHTRIASSRRETTLRTLSTFTIENSSSATKTISQRERRTTQSSSLHASTNHRTAKASSSTNILPSPKQSPLSSGNGSGNAIKDDSPRPGLPVDTQKAVVAATSAVGVIIIAVILYVLWRKRRKATASQLYASRSESSTALHSSRSRDPSITALPRYRAHRNEVPRNDVEQLFDQAIPMPGPAMSQRPTVSPLLMERIYRHSNWPNNLWKTANPPTPTTEQQPRPPSLVLHPPQAAFLRDPSNRVSRVSSYTSAKSRISTSARAVSPMEVETGSLPPSPGAAPELYERWSWTNSDAPPTPRMYPRSLASSLSTLPRFLGVRHWIRTQREREQAKLNEERPNLMERETAAGQQTKDTKSGSSARPIRKLSKRQPGRNIGPAVEQKSSKDLDAKAVLDPT